MSKLDRVQSFTEGKNASSQQRLCASAFGYINLVAI